MCIRDSREPARDLCRSTHRDLRRMRHPVPLRQRRDAADTRRVARGHRSREFRALHVGVHHRGASRDDAGRDRRRALCRAMGDVYKRQRQHDETKVVARLLHDEPRHQIADRCSNADAGVDRALNEVEASGACLLYTSRCV